MRNPSGIWFRACRDMVCSLEATYEESKPASTSAERTALRVWKLPMRNPSDPVLEEAVASQPGLEATYEESKRGGRFPHLLRGPGLEATYEESKQLVEELLGGENHKFGSYL